MKKPERTEDKSAADFDFEFTGNDTLRFRVGERVIARFEIVQAGDVSRESPAQSAESD